MNSLPPGILPLVCKRRQIQSELDPPETRFRSNAIARFVALYRGINVTGNNMVRMEALRAMHEQLGHRDVSSYIQSGNVLFSARGAAHNLSARIAKQFAGDFGFAARVMVLPSQRWKQIILANPYGQFSAGRPNTVHAGICGGEPCETDLKKLHGRVATTETFAVLNGIVYLHAPDGFGTSKFTSGMEKACGVPMTVRNWRTMETIGMLLDTAEVKRPPAARKRRVFEPHGEEED